MLTKEEKDAREGVWTALTKLGLQVQGKIPIEQQEDVAPHLVGRRQ